MNNTINIRIDGTLNEIDHAFLKLVSELQEHCAAQDWYRSFDFTFTATIASDTREETTPPSTDLGRSAADVLKRMRQSGTRD